jgi:tetratricopeptide (TPR) repeat protein
MEAGQGQPQVDTLVAYARLMYVLGEYEKSEELASAALKLDVNSRDVQYELGRLFYEKRDYPAAIAHGERALALPGVGTTDRQVHFLLARSHRKAGSTAKGEEHFQKFQASGASLRR